MNLIEEVFEVSRAVRPRNQYKVLAQLMEEAGELATEINIQEGFATKSPGEDRIIGESVDVILNAFDLIYLDNPNISPEEVMVVIRRKLEKWKKKNGII